MASRANFKPAGSNRKTRETARYAEGGASSECESEIATSRSSAPSGIRSVTPSKDTEPPSRPIRRDAGLGDGSCSEHPRSRAAPSVQGEPMKGPNATHASRTKERKRFTGFADQARFVPHESRDGGPSRPTTGAPFRVVVRQETERDRRRVGACSNARAGRGSRARRVYRDARRPRADRA
jgi:hypothetical protein